jgi:hypothetical protein
MRGINVLARHLSFLAIAWFGAALLLATPVAGQQINQTAAPIADRNQLYCAGQIRYERFPAVPEIVGAEQEQEQRVFAAGDVVYLNAGSQQGIRAGQEFMIVRPRGEPKGVHRQKSGFLGIYVQEVGQLQVIKAFTGTAVAQVTYSCESVLLGDLLTSIPARVSPPVAPEVPLDRFADPSGKQTGRIMMARFGREMITRNDIVHIDLGAEDNVAPGNYLTIYREVGTGNVLRTEVPELARGQTDNFQSRRYRGGGFGIQAQRVKDSRGNPGLYRGNPITTPEIRDKRPPLPRKIVGEMVILNVQRRTATGIITRVTQEIHTGDFVEVK